MFIFQEICAERKNENSTPQKSESVKIGEEREQEQEHEEENQTNSTLKSSTPYPNMLLAVICTQIP